MSSSASVPGVAEFRGLVESCTQCPRCRRITVCYRPDDKNEERAKSLSCLADRWLLLEQQSECAGCGRVTVQYVEEPPSSETMSERPNYEPVPKRMREMSDKLRGVKRYVGIRRWSEMESVLRQGEFLIYHLRDDLDRQRQPRLMVAYKTSFGDAHHYPIERSGDHYFVRTGPEMPAMFEDPNDLCRYFEVYQYLLGPSTIEAFPWWQMDKYEYLPNTKLNNYV